MTRRETGVGFTKLTTYIWPETKAYTYDTLTLFNPVPANHHRTDEGMIVRSDQPPEPCPPEYLSGDKLWQPADKTAAYKFNQKSGKWVFVWGIVSDGGRGRDVTNRSKS